MCFLRDRGRVVTRVMVLVGISAIFAGCAERVEWQSLNLYGRGRLPLLNATSEEEIGLNEAWEQTQALEQSLPSREAHALRIGDEWCHSVYRDEGYISYGKNHSVYHQPFVFTKANERGEEMLWFSLDWETLEEFPLPTNRDTLEKMEVLHRTKRAQYYYLYCYYYKLIEGPKRVPIFVKLSEKSDIFGIFSIDFYELGPNRRIYYLGSCKPSLPWVYYALRLWKSREYECYPYGNGYVAIRCHARFPFTFIHGKTIVPSLEIDSFLFVDLKEERYIELPLKYSFYPPHVLQGLVEKDGKTSVYFDWPQCEIHTFPTTAWKPFFRRDDF